MADQKPIEDKQSPKKPPKQLYNPRGGASQFNGGSDGYRVNSHSYPNDLFSSAKMYGGNYVIFYINVATDSKLSKKLAEEDFVKEYPARDRGDNIAQGFTKTGLVAANATANTIAGLVGGSIAFGDGAGGAAKGAAVANIPTVGVGAASTMAPDATRSQKRLKTAIALHVPNQLNIRYGVTWSEEDTAILAQANAGGGEIIKALTPGNKDSNATGTGQAIISSLALANAPNAAASGALLGLAANPKKEQVFKGVDFRTFQFEYQFFPRSSTEAQNIQNIIKEFKYHMHPEFKDDYNFVYIYPSEFDIFYYQGGKENLNLHRHTSCVLTELNVNYTPNGQFTTFPDGMPTQINITMSFRELALLTKDKIEDHL